MTAASPTPPNPPGPSHPDLDAIADLDAGVLDDAAAAEITDHVSRCAQCTAVLNVLRSVRIDLGGLPRPAVPDQVADRLDQTLLELRAGRVVALEPTRRRRRLQPTKLTSIAAAVVAVVALGAGITSVLTKQGAKENASSSAGGAVQEPAHPQSDAGGPAKAAPPSMSSAEAGLPSYTDDSLPSAVTKLEQAYSSPTAKRAASLAGAMSNSARRSACLTSLHRSESTLRATQWIRFNGQPAFVFVFQDNGKRTVLVVSDDCGQQAYASVLYQRTG